MLIFHFIPFQHNRTLVLINRTHLETEGSYMHTYIRVNFSCEKFQPLGILWWMYTCRYFLGPTFLPLLTHSVLCRWRPLKIYFLTIDSAHVQIDALGHCYQKWSHFAYVKFKLLWSVNVKKTQSSRLKNSEKRALKFVCYFHTLRIVLETFSFILELFKHAIFKVDFKMLVLV